MATGRYLYLDPHFSKRCAQRHVELRDWKKAIRLARTCVAYGGRATMFGGTDWRITGPDIENDDLTVGVEAFQDHLGKRALLVTVL